jgi:hypothetical protein
VTGTTLPIILAVAGVIAAVVAYRSIRRGGARFYTLEREAMLRRAGFILLGSTLLLLLAIGLLVNSYRQMAAPADPGDGDVALTGTPTAESRLETSPPTATPTLTPDPNVPTPTVTPIICRAVVDGTAGSGLVLRDAPGGAELTILPDGTILALMEESPADANGFTWRKVVTVAREEGWVVEDFLKMGDCG